MKGSARWCRETNPPITTHSVWSNFSRFYDHLKSVAPAKAKEGVCLCTNLTITFNMHSSLKTLTCKPCSCCRSSGCGCRTWTARRARWWHTSQPRPPRWWCPGSPAGFQFWSVMQGRGLLISEQLIKNSAASTPAPAAQDTSGISHS